MCNLDNLVSPVGRHNNLSEYMSICILCLSMEDIVHDDKFCFVVSGFLPQGSQSLIFLLVLK